MTDQAIAVTNWPTAITPANEWQIIRRDDAELIRRMRLLVVGGLKLRDDEIIGYANFAKMHDLNPFVGECFYIPGVGPYAGIAGYRRKAQEQLEYEAARIGSKIAPNFWTESRDATHAEAIFKDGDVAIHVTLYDSITRNAWLSELSRMMRELAAAGVPNPAEEAKKLIGPVPSWTGVGVVGQGEDSGKGKWDKRERAEKRAMKNALKKRFTRLAYIPEPEWNGDEPPIPAFSISAPEEPRQISAEIQNKGEAELLMDLGFASKTEPAPEPTTDFDLKAYLEDQAEHCSLPNEKQVRELAACLGYILRSDAARYELLSYLAGKPIAHSKDMPDLRILTALHEYMQPAYDTNGAAYYPGNREAERQITHAHAEYLKAQGQQQLF